MEDWKDPETPLIWLSAGTFILLVFLVFILLSFKTYIQRIRKEEEEKRRLQLAHQKKLLENTIASEEREKKRIAQSLHDDLLAQLYRVKLMNDNKEIASMLEQSMDQLRQISHELLPPLLAEISFEELMKDFLYPFKKKYQVVFQVNTTNGNILEQYKKLQLFRVFQEVVVNIEKHAKACSIEIGWRNTPHYCCLIIHDDGIGIGEEQKKGLGFKNIETRVQVINGKFRFKSEKDKGTTFLLLVNI